MHSTRASPPHPSCRRDPNDNDDNAAGDNGGGGGRGELNTAGRCRSWTLRSLWWCWEAS